MAQQYIFQMQGLTKAYPGAPKKVFENIWLSFYSDAKIGVVGVNGSGKSSLLKIMAGIDKEFAGEAFAAEGTKRGYLEQEPQLDDKLDVWANVIAWCDEKKIFDDYNAIAAKLGEDYTDELMEQMTALQEKLDAGDLWDIDSRIEMAMGALRCPPNDWPVDKLSGGERRRVALARLLLSKPDMMLLDEPTNHLDAESVAWLQHHLEDFPGCVILVTHDRYFLDQVTKWTLELDRGKGLPYEGNYSAWLEQKTKRIAQEEREEAGKKRAIERELAWVRSSPSARRTKSKARLAAFHDLQNEAENAKQTFAQIQIPPGPRLGQQVIEVTGLEKEYGDKILFKGLTFKLPPGGIVGVIGPNGAGKSTLFNLITGHLQPSAGKVIVDGRDITGVAPYKLCSMGMGRSFQRTNIFPKLSVLENVQAAFLIHRGQGPNFWSRSDAQLRQPEAARARHCARQRSQDPAARRADRRHVGERDARVDRADRPHRPRARPDLAVHRARHGRGVLDRPEDRRAAPGPHHRPRRASRGARRPRGPARLPR
jgi:ATPase subunit of ABC transporter with duplicated ATPase domains